MLHTVCSMIVIQIKKNSLSSPKLNRTDLKVDAVYSIPYTVYVISYESFSMTQTS